MHTHALSKIAAVQDECRAESKAAAVEIMHSHYPYKSKQWIHRNFHMLMALSPDDLARVLQYQDPTGERAVRNVLAQQAEAVAA